MSARLEDRLTELRQDFSRVTGRPFDHFFCPILYRDEDADLCEAHVINKAFTGASRAWTVQRADVDSFYGSVFESDFEFVQYRELLSPVRVLSSSKLSKGMNLTFFSGDKEVEHYIPRGPVPETFSLVTVEDQGGAVSVALKVPPQEVIASAGESWRVDYSKDARLAAFVSLVKAAHLTLFELLGYSYVFNAGGAFVGHDLLGRFFLGRQQTKTESLSVAQPFFERFQHMARPLLRTNMELQGSISDRTFIACSADEQVWALIVFVNTGGSLYSVMVPTNKETIPMFLAFLQDDSETIQGQICQYRDSAFQWSDSVELQWPKTGVLLV